eukprot:5073540-Lingulodinium_polyedra.AAC.1
MLAHLGPLRNGAPPPRPGASPRGITPFAAGPPALGRDIGLSMPTLGHETSTGTLRLPVL